VKDFELISFLVIEWGVLNVQYSWNV
jgi:hypothetical protein